MKVTVIYKKTGEQIATYYTVRKIEKDEVSGSKEYVTIFFERDEENEVTIFSPLSFSLDKYDLVIS